MYRFLCPIRFHAIPFELVWMALFPHNSKEILQCEAMDLVLYDQWRVHRPTLMEERASVDESVEGKMNKLLFLWFSCQCDE